MSDSGKIQRLCLCRFPVQVIGGIYACLMGMQDGFNVSKRRIVIAGKDLTLLVEKAAYFPHSSRGAPPAPMAHHG